MTESSNSLVTTTTTTKSTTSMSPEIISKIVTSGDITALTPEQQLQYYYAMCERVGLDPMTQPFGILKLESWNKKTKRYDTRTVLYCNRSGTQQLGKSRNVSVTDVKIRTDIEGVLVCECTVSTPDGRSTQGVGAVSLTNYEGQPLKGNALANAIMHAQTKASRRGILDHCGLGIIDESEVSSIEHAQRIAVPEPKKALPPLPTLPKIDEIEAVKALRYADDTASERPWHQVICHVGKAANKSLGELTLLQLGWLAYDWQPKNTQMNTALKAAAEAGCRELEITVEQYNKHKQEALALEGKDTHEEGR